MLPSGERRTFAMILPLSAAVSCLLVITKPLSRRKRERQPKFRRTALMRPLSGSTATPWLKLLSCGTSADFIVFMNLSRPAFFNCLSPKFEEAAKVKNFGSPYRRTASNRGRTRLLRYVDITGLVLTYLKRSDPMYRLCVEFGIVPSTAQVCIDIGLEVLLRIVRDPSSSDFDVTWPDNDAIKESAMLLERNRKYGRLLKGIFAVTDGARMPSAKYTNSNIQNAFFEGFTQGTEVTNLLVWNFKG